MKMSEESSLEVHTALAECTLDFFFLDDWISNSNGKMESCQKPTVLDDLAPPNWSIDENAEEFNVSK